MGLLSACGLPMSENVQVEELLRAPRLPGDYGALQNALNEWLGESAQLKYPMQGELLSPFLLQDLEGMQAMRTLGNNMAWLLKCIAAGKAAGVDFPEREPAQKTNFIR